MRKIDSSSLSNQSLASALLCHTYTADVAREIFVRLFADQVAGNGDYVAYVTIQLGGSGSAYRVVPKTTATVASGVTAIALTTIPFPLSAGDVLKVYLTGLAGDTTTPDIATEVWDDGPGLVAHQGTAQGGASGSITLASTASATNDLYKGQVVEIVAGTGAGQSRVITGYTGSSKVATVGRNWATNPDSTSIYAVLSLAVPVVDDNLRVDVGKWLGTAAATPNTAGVPLVDTKLIEGTDATDTIDARLLAFMGAAGASLTAAGLTQTQVRSAIGLATANLDTQLDALPTNAELATALAAADDAVLAAIAALNNLSSAGAQAAALAALVAYDAATGSDVPAVGAIADAVWDELLSGHAVSGSAGAALSASGSAADPLTNEVPGDYDSGTAGAVLGAIVAQAVRFVSVIGRGGLVETVRGTDYNASAGTAIDWTLPEGATWPTDLTGYTITVVVKIQSTDLSFTGSVVTATGSGRKVRLALTAAQSATIPQNEAAGWRYSVKATSGSLVSELARGNWRSFAMP